MKVLCPHCKGRAIVPDDKRGTAFSCPLCAGLIRVRKPAPTPAPVEAKDEPIPLVEVVVVVEPAPTEAFSAGAPPDAPTASAPSGAYSAGEPPASAPPSDPEPAAESRRTKRRRRKRSAPRRTPRAADNRLAFLTPYCGEILLIGLPILVGLILIPLPLLLPSDGLAIALTLAIAMLVASFIRTCVLCAQDGEEPPPVGELLSYTGVRAVDLVLCILLVFYPLYWWFIQVRCMLGYPRGYLPWLVLQAYSMLVIAAVVAVHLKRNSIWDWLGV
jgi:hypothetical protein